MGRRDCTKHMFNNMIVDQSFQYFRSVRKCAAKPVVEKGSLEIVPTVVKCELFTPMIKKLAWSFVKSLKKLTISTIPIMWVGLSAIQLDIAIILASFEAPKYVLWL